MFQYKYLQIFPSSEDDHKWYDEMENIGYLLAVAYVLLFMYALIQFIRLKPQNDGMVGPNQNKWTIQNIFHLVIVVVTGLRAAEFTMYHKISEFRGEHDTQTGDYKGEAVWFLIVDIPGLLYYNAYTTCVLFYAYVFHQLQGFNILLKLRPIYFIVNAIVYTVVIGLLVLMMVIVPPQEDSEMSVPVEGDGGQWNTDDYLLLAVILTMALLALVLAIFYLVYGFRLYLLLKRFPIETRGRRRKMREVGQVTLICTVCFGMRFIFLMLYAFQEQIFQEKDPIPAWIKGLYFLLCEIIPTAWVFYILRKAPPRPQQAPSQGEYTQLPSGSPSGV